MKITLLAVTSLLTAVFYAGCTTSVENLETTRLKATDSDILTVCTLGSTKNPHRFGDIVLAGQPSREDFQVASRIGIKTVVTLRHPDEISDWNEEEVVAGLGMKFIRIPFKPVEELTDSVFDKAREQLKSAPRPILVHCGSANRVGALWIPFRVLDEDIPIEQALSEAKEIGLRMPEYQLRAEEYIKKTQ